VFAVRHSGRLRKPERCASRAFAASSTGRAWRSCPLGTKFAAEPRTRPYGLAHSQRQISLYVSRPAAHVGRTGLFLTIYRDSALLLQPGEGVSLPPLPGPLFPGAFVSGGT